MPHESSITSLGAEISLNGSTIPAPAGIVSVLDNPPNGNHIAIPVISVCVVITAIFYLFRFYAKYLSKKFNVADYLSIIGFLLFWVYVYNTYSLSWTTGYLVHQWDIRLEDIAAFSYVCWLSTILYLWMIAFVKCAILLEWTRIFSPLGTRSHFTWACYATCGAISSLSIVIFIMDMVNCTPFARNWDPLIPGSFCRFGIPQFGLASATTNLVLDLIPLVLAQRIIWNLHISQKKKIGVSAIFLVGVTGCVASIVRLYYATRFYISDDTTYYFSIMALCSLCETTCAHLILCAPCIPKAIMGLKQTNTFKGLRRYTKNTTTYVNNPNIFRETNVNYRIRKPREHWFMSSKIPGNDITHSEDSERSLRQPTIN